MGLSDFETCVDQTGESLDFSQKPTKCFDESCCEGADKPKVKPFLGPINLDSYTENGDLPLNLNSPLSRVNEVSKVVNFHHETNVNQDLLSNVDESSSPRTPTNGVFDPFAPGPEDKAWAPQCKKYSDEARNSVARRLNFGSAFKGLGDKCNDAESISDEQMFELVYENLLEAIVSNQTEGALSNVSEMELDSDSWKRPLSAPQLAGIADPCIGAQTKSTGTSRIIDMGLCRKLEF